MFYIVFERTRCMNSFGTLIISAKTPNPFWSYYSKRKIPPVLTSMLVFQTDCIFCARLTLFQQKAPPRGTCKHIIFNIRQVFKAFSDGSKSQFLLPWNHSKIPKVRGGHFCHTSLLKLKIIPFWASQHHRNLNIHKVFKACSDDSKSQFWLLVSSPKNA